MGHSSGLKLSRHRKSSALTLGNPKINEHSSHIFLDLGHLENSISRLKIYIDSLLEEFLHN